MEPQKLVPLVLAAAGLLLLAAIVYRLLAGTS